MKLIDVGSNDVREDRLVYLLSGILLYYGLFEWNYIRRYGNVTI
jgi:hypothetical protein